MDLDISIVNWNTCELLETCLASLQSYIDPARVQVFVVDNASKDGSAAMVASRFAAVRLIQSGGNIGFGRGHNLVRNHGTAPYVLFLNPDTEFREAAHDRMLEFMRSHPEVGAVTCRLTYLNGATQPLGVQWFPTPFKEMLALVLFSDRTRGLARRLFPMADPTQSGYLSKIYGGCIMVRREVLDRIGWFDERFFMYAEDVDLCRRIRDCGYRLYYLGDTRVVHLVGGAGKKTSSQFCTLMKCESVSKLIEKYYGRQGRWRYRLGVFVGGNMRLCVLLLVRLLSLGLPLGRSVDFRGAFLKYSAMVQWSLRLRQPVIRD